MVVKSKTLAPLTSAHLDMIRGIAAIAVMVGHIRGLFFFDYKDVTAPSSVATMIYALTGLGHQAVLVFFVLSGFFVGGSALKSARNWSWKHYLLNRFVRLYLVLIPALLLTAVLDYFAYRQPGGHIYFDLPIPHFNRDALVTHHSLSILLGNLFFLQKLRVETFGSNDALWSLSAEFWYYILFPALMLALYQAVNIKRRTTAILLALAVVAWLPWWIYTGFVVWLMGTAITSLPDVTLPRAPRWLLQFVSGGIFARTLLLSRLHPIPGEWGELALGLSFAGWLYCLVRIKPSSATSGGFYTRLAGVLSGCSYSVYAIHLPIVMLVRTSFGTELWQPTLFNLALGGIFSLLVLLAGWLFSRLTEANNDQIRARVFKLLSAGAAA